MSERDRVISITLTEAEWQAFIARQPRPVDWIRARILDEVGALPTEPKPASHAATKPIFN